MEDSIVLIKLVLDSISNNNIEELTSLIQRMPLEKLDQSHSDNLLQILLSQATLLNRGEAAKVIMNRFIETNANEENLPLFTYMFTNLSFSDDILKFLAPLYPEITFSEHMTNIIAFDEDPIIPRACNRLILIYGEQSNYTYKLLYDVAEENENNQMMDYLSFKIQETADYAPVPEWIKNFVVWLEPTPEGTIEEPPGKIVAIARDREAPPSSETIPYDDEIILPEPEPVSFDLPSTEEAVNLLTDGLEFLGISTEDIEEAKQVLRTQLTIATAEEKYLILRPIMENQARKDLSSDALLFRILGPANPPLDADLTTDDPKLKYGGCRMFTCNHIDQVDPEDDTIDEDADWFTGNCDYCNLKIANYCHAIRRPLSHGHFTGCYCSFDCLKNDFNETAPNIAETAMIDRIQGQLNEYGIQNRLSR